MNRQIDSNSAMFKKYIDDSVIVSNYKINQEFQIIPETESIKIVVISDTHFGNKNENLEYLDKVRDYIEKNDIKYLLHVGDLIEGLADPNYSIEKQIDFILNDYFVNKGIINIVLLGNHDASLLMSGIYDLEKVLEETNATILGYKCAYLKICNRYIKLRHQINRMINNLNDYKSMISFYGHSHIYKFRKKENGASIIKLPTLSDDCPQGHAPINSGFVILELFINDDQIYSYTVEVIDFNRRNTLKREMSLSLR